MTASLLRQLATQINFTAKHTEEDMNQILFYKPSLNAKGSETRYFFVRAFQERQDDVSHAHKDSLSYNTKKFVAARTLHPELTCYDSVQNSKSRKELIEGHEALGYVCLNDDNHMF